MHWYDPNGFTLTLMAIACGYIVYWTREEWRMRREMRRRKRAEQVRLIVEQLTPPKPWNTEVEE